MTVGKETLTLSSLISQLSRLYISPGGHYGYKCLPPVHYWWPGNGAIKTRRQPGGCFNNRADEDVWGIKVHWVNCGSLKQKRKDKVQLTKILLEQAYFDPIAALYSTGSW